MILQILIKRSFIIIAAFACTFSYGQNSQGLKRYIFFENQSEAVGQAFERVWNYIAPAQAPNSYQLCDEVLNELWPVFIKYYDHENGKKESITKPIILLSSISETSTVGLIREGKTYQTNAIIISHELTLNKNNLTFVLAHELIHYMEAHALTINPIDQILEIKIDGIVKEKLIDDFSKLYISKSMLGLSANRYQNTKKIAIDGELGKVLSHMIQNTRRSNQLCSNLSIHLSRLQSYMRQDYFFRYEHENVNEFLSHVESCFNSEPPQLFSDSFSQLISENKNLIDTNSTNELTLIEQNNTKLNFEKLFMINDYFYKHYEVSKYLDNQEGLRIVTEEDQADIKAIEILFAMGKRNFKAALNYLLADLKTTEQIMCDKKLSTNTEPDYGKLSNQHHKECWRIWRASNLEESLLSEQ